MVPRPGDEGGSISGTRRFSLESLMRLSGAGVALASCLFFAPAAAEAQAGKLPSVGFLCWVTCGDPYHEAFWQALRKLGYADYKNISFENRAAGGDHGSL